MSDGSTALVVCEFFTAGGRLPGGSARNDALVAEGLAMVRALLADLAELPALATTAVVRPDLLDALPPGVRAEPAEPDPASAACRALGRRDGSLLWPIAPETRGHLVRLVRTGTRCGADVVGPAAEAVRRSSDRWRLLRHLARAGVPVPPTSPARDAEGAVALAWELGGDVVVKPGRGAGGAGVVRARGRAEVSEAWARAAEVEPFHPPIVQRFVKGTPASVSVLASDSEVRALALSRQRIRFSPEARYLGGVLPFRHPDRDRAEEVAARAVRAAGGLRGLVGVDLVLARVGPVVMEVNPRLTTSYLGLRTHVGAAAAEAALRAAGVSVRTERRRARPWTVPPRVPDAATPSRFGAAP